MRSRTLGRGLARFGGLLLLALAAACGSPTAPTPVLETEIFAGTLDVLGADSKTFVVKHACDISDASVTITGLNKVADAAPQGTTIGVGFGSLASNGSCARDPNFSTSAANLNQELVATGVFFAGTFCVQIFDAGTLTEPVSYSLTVKHY